MWLTLGDYSPNPRDPRTKDIRAFNGDFFRTFSRRRPTSTRASLSPVYSDVYTQRNPHWTTLPSFS